VVRRPTGSYPETGLEEMSNDLLQADFGTTSSESALERNFCLSPSCVRDPSSAPAESPLVSIQSRERISG
jgi:hypothetical protein